MNKNIDNLLPQVSVVNLEIKRDIELITSI